MKSKFFAQLSSFAVVALLFMFGAVTTLVQAQEEGVPTVVDEVIAQVNDQVVTLSMLRREMREAVEALKATRNMSEQQATEEVARNQPKIIANLIDEQLIVQKAKDIPRLTEDIEAEVNREMLRVAKAQGITTLEELERRLSEQKIDSADIRQTLRMQLTRQAVLQREVDAKIYFGLGDSELKKYYEANRAKLAKPESVELSEIYLSLAGKPEAEVRAKAEQLVAQARAAADFGALAVTHSEREADGKRVAAETKGKVGRYQLTDLRPEFAAAIKNLSKGGVSDPIRSDEGYQIIRVDDRTAAGESTFSEEQVRGAMTQERAEKEREAYLGILRKEAYIDVGKDYKESVMPLLNLTPPSKAEAQKTASKTATTAADKKSADKKP